ncbi:ABC transporter ATP-binding protein [Actinobacillus pleuropneumoniae]|uniref:ABC transporter ATP-binding protein n=1 Tax=Actinobacillus pleuropneumoniae TaxID=715 RepID=UPI0001E49E2A|nr:ABC transporter ATP-binding protein [Actinobacillus pleuropneumoniae]EFN00174.1 O-antigen export system ATP-binding protein RfbB [Actinobacillus pleuropneumoniae serovar 12 str. 1096]UKH29189.1 ABC transporter ATP-binding protein [Actinobacillus pleuropneumoniae]
MHIKLENVSVRFPIYDAKQRSFKQTLLNAATGGRIIANNNNTEIEALKNINLDIKQGDRVSLIGHNGSGKTTLLRVLSGVYAPTTGRISVQGKITSLLDSMLGMDGEASGLENIKLRGLFLGLKPKDTEKLVDEIIDFSELGDFINMPVRTYSSGMVLRLAFSISTCVHPEILLMDEWMSVGDEQFKNKAEKRLTEFVDKAGILVMATHDHQLAKRVCNKHVYLEHGVIRDIK